MPQWAIHRISRGIEERTYGNFRGPTKKEVEFPGVMKKKSFETSMGLARFSILEFREGVIQASRKVYLTPCSLDFFSNNPTLLRNIL